MLINSLDRFPAAPIAITVDEPAKKKSKESFFKIGGKALTEDECFRELKIQQNNKKSEQNKKKSCTKKLP